MTPVIFALVAVAAVMHAAWNALLKGSEEPLELAARSLAASTALITPVIALAWLFSGRPGLTVLGWLLAVASGVLEAAYFVSLSEAYRRGALSVVYPIARGSAPVLVLLISVIALGSSASAPAAIGVLVVAAGIVLVRGIGAAGRASDLALALSVGACIAGYTLVDKHGIVHGDPISYLEVVFAIVAAAYVVGVWRVRGALALRAAVTPRSVLAGIGYFGAYALTLAALKLAPAASVAAVRESSVVMATGFLALTGREHVGARRLVGAVAVAGGIALISLG